jgi:hypothetical protein
MAQASPFDKVLDQILNGRTGLRPTLTSLSDRPLGTVQPCPQCDEEVTWKEYTNSVGRSVRYWSDCSCVVAAAERMSQRSKESTALQADYRNEDARHVLPPALANFTLDTFDATRLAGGEKLLTAARRWLETITPLSVAPGYFGDPRPCLYFYSQGKGRGKTHLAAALLHAAAERGKSTAFADEVGYIESYWAAPFERKAELSAWPAEKAWLTVLDDLGQRERTSDTLRDAWYDVVNPRWLRCGWTIITSNWAPQELLDKGTISEATYSRIVQMTRGQLVTFQGTDQRLPQREAEL